MLRKRIIFTLIYCDGSFMQSRNFRLQKVGDINWLEKNYKFQDIAFSLDELIVLNASRAHKDIAAFARVIERLAGGVFIPLAAGGGIRSMQDAEVLFGSGADKIVLNTTLSVNPRLVEALVSRYGTQSVVASVDYKIDGDSFAVFINDGATKLDMALDEYLGSLTELGVGEIFLNSMDKDGTGFGFDLGTIQRFATELRVPLIASGGAGNDKHFLEVLSIARVDAASTANLFNFMADGLPIARRNLIANDINLARWQDASW